MAQWMNLHQNNSFVNQMRLSLLCEEFGAILLVLMGLTAGRPACNQAKYVPVDFEILKFSTDYIIRIFMAFNKDTVLL